MYCKLKDTNGPVALFTPSLAKNKELVRCDEHGNDLVDAPPAPVVVEEVKPVAKKAKAKAPVTETPVTEAPAAPALDPVVSSALDSLFAGE